MLFLGGVTLWLHEVSTALLSCWPLFISAGDGTVFNQKRCHIAQSFLLSVYHRPHMTNKTIGKDIQYAACHFYLRDKVFAMSILKF